MDTRRLPRTVPKVRQVGFFAPNDSPVQPSRTQSGPEGSNSPPLSDSPASNSLSPVMIPPPRHLSDNLTSRVTAAVPVPDSGYRRPNAGENVTVGSYNTSESLLRDEEFSEDAASSQGPGFFSRSDSTKFASSFPGGGFDLTSLKSSSEAKAATATPIEVNKPVGAPGTEKSGGAVAVAQDELSSSSKPVKAKTTRAERRALQESQRSAKAVGKAEGNKTAAVSKATVSGKPAKQPSQRKEGPPAASSVAAPEKKGVDHPPKRERKKDAPPPRMQFDDKNRVEKAKRRAVLNQMEARNQVELFRHLPQYEWGTQLPDLESNFFQVKLDPHPIHPAVYKVGLQYLAGDISGGNARCIAMLHAFQEAIRDYSTPAEKTLVIDLTAKIKSYAQFFNECRSLSMSMRNAITFLKRQIISLNLSESEAKAVLCSEIDRFINEKIVLADKVIVRHAATKIRDGDVLLTHGSSCVVEMILLYTHELGKQFHVVIVDSHPKLEGQALLRRLVAKGLSCTYTHINAVSYIMHDVTRVFLGASSVLSNGTVYSRIGTSCVAMVAHAFHVPVLICCEAYKFHERVLLDSICSNELGDPDAIAKIHGRTDVNYLDDLSNTKNLQLLNLLYDATPSDYISVIITDYGMIPPTSVPVIVREYSGDHLWM